MHLFLFYRSNIPCTLPLRQTRQLWLTEIHFRTVTRTPAVLKFLPVGDFDNISVAHPQIKEIEIKLRVVWK